MSRRSFIGLFTPALFIMSKIPEQASALGADSPHLDVKKRKIHADGSSGHYYVDKSAAGAEAELPGGAREVGGLGDAKAADAAAPGSVPLTDDVEITSRPVYTEVSVVGEAPDAVKTDLAAVQPAVKPAKVC